jgi:hypothetical protein
MSIDTLARFGSAFNDWINKLRQSNAKALTFILLCIGTFMVWAYCAIRHVQMDMAAFSAWLGFVAVIGGFSLGQFNVERKTDYGYVERATGPKPSSVSSTVETPGARVTTTMPAARSPEDAG